MDEYQVGQVAQAADGKLYRFKGGDPANRANWEAADAVQAPPVEAKPAVPPGGKGQAVLDFLQMLSQGVTSRFGDEIAGLAAAVPGGLTPAEARDYSRRATAEAKARHPVMSALAEGAGVGATGALVPAAIGRGAVAAGGGLLGAVTKGGIVGGIEGGLFGAGGAEGGIKPRAKAAIVPAAIGAGVGAATAAIPVLANAATKRAAGRGERVAGALKETSGVGEDINVTRTAVDEAVAQAQQHYKVFESQPPVTQMDIAKSNLSQAIRDRLPKGNATFNELQDLRASLRQTDKASANALSSFMQKHYPGLKEADAAYAGAQSTMRTLRKAEQVFSKSGADIEYAAGKLKPGQQEPFRQMLVQKTADALTMRDEAAGAMLKNLMDQGAAGARKVRQYFPSGQSGDAAYEQFQRILNTEKSAARVGAMFKSIVGSRALWYGGVGGAGFVAGRSLFR